MTLITALVCLSFAAFGSSSLFGSSSCCSATLITALDGSSCCGSASNESGNGGNEPWSRIVLRLAM